VERTATTSEALSPATGLTQVWRTDFTSLKATSGTPSSAYDWHFELFEPNGEVEQYTTNICNNAATTGGSNATVASNWNYCIQGGQATGGGQTTDGNVLQIRAQNDGGTIHSGRLNSKRMHEFVPSANQGLQYEASIKFDANSINNGSWPAFWMLQRNIQEDPVINDGDTALWPCNGAQEVDIMEMGSVSGWGNNYNQSSLHSDTGACTPQSPNNNPQVNNNHAYQLDDGNYHKFTMEFECGSSCAASATMRFFVDGVQQGGDVGTTGWGFDSVGSFFILDYAVGGGLGGGVNSGSFNSPGRSMYVDYVNVASYNPSSRNGPCGPYGGTAAAIPGTIQSENYDTCGANASYYDTTAGNSGGAYRSDDVDIEASTDSGGGYDVGWVAAGEWLKYSANVASSGTYNAQVRVASTTAGNTMHINVDGTNVTGSLAIPNTGGWQTWATVTSPNFSLSAGAHTVQAVFDSGNNNINWMAFSSVGGCGPYGGSAAAIPGTIQAENYDTCGANNSYYDTTAGNSGGAYRSDDVDIEATSDTGGGYDVGWTAGGEWLKYSANVSSAGTYNVQARLAATAAGNTMHVNVDGTNVSGSLAIPNTGGWQTWQTVTSPNFSLSAGAHTVQVVFDSGGCNLNWVAFATAGSCTPTTCSAQGANCGSIADGCGGTLNCGSCSGSQTCGGGGTANVCGGSSCTPTTCSAQGKNCGSISDGCGGTLNCGTCGSGQTCSSTNVCQASGGGSCSPTVTGYNLGKCNATAVYNGSLYKCISQAAGVNGEPTGCGTAGVYCSNITPTDAAWGTTAWQFVQTCP
jgi:hypothetical protein